MVANTVQHAKAAAAGRKQNASEDMRTMMGMMKEMQNQFFVMSSRMQALEGASQAADEPLKRPTQPRHKSRELHGKEAPCCQEFLFTMEP